MRTEKQNQFMTVRDLAEKLAIAPMTVYRLINQGKIRTVRIGRVIRFDPADIAAFLESVRVGPAGLIEEESMKEENHERRKSRKSNPGQN